MLTALETLEDKVRGLRTGADDYLAKPFAFEQLLARVHALGRRGPGYRDNAAELRVHDLVLDRETREVRRGDRLIELTRRELALLECLIGSRGKALSRSLILAKVWGYSKHPLNSVVEVCIRHLRRKVDPGRVDAPDRTVRGFGFSIRTP